MGERKPVVMEHRHSPVHTVALADGTIVAWLAVCCDVQITSRNYIEGCPLNMQILQIPGSFPWEDWMAPALEQPVSVDITDWHPRWTWRDTYFALCLVSLLFSCVGVGLGGQLHAVWVGLLGTVVGFGTLLVTFIWAMSRHDR